MYCVKWILLQSPAFLDLLGHSHVIQDKGDFALEEQDRRTR